MEERLPFVASAARPTSPSRLESGLPCLPASARNTSSFRISVRTSASSCVSPSDVPSSALPFAASAGPSAAASSHSRAVTCPQRLQHVMTDADSSTQSRSFRGRQECQRLTNGSPAFSSSSFLCSFAARKSAAVTRATCASPRRSSDGKDEEEDAKGMQRYYIGETILIAESATQGIKEKTKKPYGRPWVRSLLHTALLWAVLLAISLAIFHILLYSSLLSKLLPLAFSAEPAAHQLLPSDFAAAAYLHNLLVGLPLPNTAGRNSIEASAVVVGPTGTIRAPYSRVIDHLLKLVTLPLLTGEPRYVTGDDFSIIIPVRNEEEFLPKTLKYLFEATPPETIREVIVVDDNSDTPIEGVVRAAKLPDKYLRKVVFIRFDTNEGLIRARVAGAAVAQSDNLFFLDGHCRPWPGWAAPLLLHLKTNYRRIACPQIGDIYPTTWEEVGTHGYKMMFEWNFEFGWYYDASDETPILSGGILAITKKWWKESGEYDVGMLEWGGENLEQSLRVWMCGGEIVAVPESAVGHIFNRKPKPNPENRLVIQVQKNQKRAAKVWLDEYYYLFYKYHADARHLEEKSLHARQQLRYERLKCVPFEWFAERFRTAFERKNLLDHRFLHIQHEATGWCLSTKTFPLENEQERLIVEPCIRNKRAQLWTLAAGKRMIANRNKKCIDAFLSQKGGGLRTPVAFDCDWQQTFTGENTNQFWQWDIDDPYDSPDRGTRSITKKTTDARDTTHRSGRIFSFPHVDAFSLSGDDVLPVSPAHATAARARCLSVVLPDIELSSTPRPLHSGPELPSAAIAKFYTQARQRERKVPEGGDLTRGEENMEKRTEKTILNNSSNDSNGQERPMAPAVATKKGEPLLLIDSKNEDEDLLFIGRPPQQPVLNLRHLAADVNSDTSQEAVTAVVFAPEAPHGSDNKSSSDNRISRQQQSVPPESPVERSICPNTDALPRLSRPPHTSSSKDSESDSGQVLQHRVVLLHQSNAHHSGGEGAETAFRGERVTTVAPTERSSDSRTSAATLVLFPRKSGAATSMAAGAAKGSDDNASPAAADSALHVAVTQGAITAATRARVYDTGATAQVEGAAVSVHSSARSEGNIKFSEKTKTATEENDNTGTERSEFSPSIDTEAELVLTAARTVDEGDSSREGTRTDEEPAFQRRMLTDTSTVGTPPAALVFMQASAATISPLTQTEQKKMRHRFEPSSAAEASTSSSVADHQAHVHHNMKSSPTDSLRDPSSRTDDIYGDILHVGRRLSNSDTTGAKNPEAVLFNYRLVTWRFCDEPKANNARFFDALPQPSSASAAGGEAGLDAAAAVDGVMRRLGKAGSRSPDAAMRFKPLWVIAPLSSRFGRRTLHDAATISDTAARAYLAVYPDVEV